jgi:GNAT superfamily N-acetyltransferase
MKELEKHTVVLKQALPSDAATIAALHTESWRNAYRGILTDDYLDHAIFEERQRYWQESLNAPHPERRLILLAEQVGELVAFVSVFLDVDPSYGTLIDNLHVLPHVQGQGLGRLLMGQAAQWTLAQNVKQMHLWVYEANQKARKFYEALGGKAVEKKLESFPENTENEVLRYVWKDLKPLLKVES